jgi:L-ascorbate metabolism protein UlaG (beta-lactamase superfamily)
MASFTLGKRVLTILVTRDPEQDIEATRIIDPRTAVPAHYSEYTFFESPQKTSSGRAASRFKAL